MSDRILLGVRVTPRAQEKIKRIAMQDGRSVSNLVNQWIDKELKKSERKG